MFGQKTCTIEEMIEESAEFGERFPDQTNDEVIEFVEEVCNIHIPEYSLFQRVLISAYNVGSDAGKDNGILAGIRAATLYGFSPNDCYEAIVGQ